MTPDELFQKAFGCHQAGHFDEAADLYDQLVAQWPTHADLLQFRGAVDVQRNKFESALQWFARALAANPDLGAAYVNRAAALIGLGRFEEALVAAEQGVTLAPQSIAAVNNKVSALNRLGRAADALRAADAVLARGREDASLHANRAESFLAQRKYAEMVAACDRAIALNPELAHAHSHRGHALTRLERPVEAAVSFQRALALYPDSAVGHYSQALALQYGRKPIDAIAACDRALALQPAFSEALVIRAAALNALDRHADAIADCDAALALRPDFADAYAVRGLAFKGAKQPERALADFEIALDLDPELEHIPGQRVYLRLQMHEWEGLAEDIEAVLAAIDAGKCAAQPLVVNTLPSSPAQQQMAAGHVFLAENPAPRGQAQPTRPLGEKLRVAYFSSDLHEHPVGQLLVGLFEAHDRSRFEIVAFGFGGDPKNVTRRRIERACDRFIEARHMSGPEMVALAREMNVHIAVDLNGFTVNNRTDVFAEGAAPIQVNYLGFPGTMGTNRYQYIIGDQIVTPPEHFPYFGEQVVTMPHSYLVTNDIKRHIPARLSTRREFGVPETGFIFCSFNASYKITPEAFDIWMRLLRQVDGSILWLLDHGPTAVRNLRNEARRRGIDPQRLVFAARTPGLEYLARYRLADLFLDTFNYNAHATASEALMMGLPVVTRVGRAFAGRVGASLLTALGLPELIAVDNANYERIALHLAQSPGTLKDMREKLMRNAATYPLFDTVRYARNLEKAYREMWRRHAQGLGPGHIEVVEERP